MSILSKMHLVRLSGMQSEAIEFRGPAGSDFRVWLSFEALEAILATVAKAGRCETGGILIGRHDADGWMAEVVEATTKPPGSRAGKWWFHRGNVGLGDLLAARWDSGYHYLGEWHSHPGGSTEPSDTDKRSMRKIAADDAYQCPQPVLIVVGGSVQSIWSISASICQHGVHIPLHRV